jgi:putative SOS response-associated peptidase YedK
MPVVLPEAVESEWLSAGPDARKELYQPYPDNDLTTYEIFAGRGERH